MTKEFNPNLKVEQTLLSDVFKQILAARGADKKIEVLRKYDSPALRTILLLNYAESIKFDLPEGETPIRDNQMPEGLGHQYLYSTYRDLEKFIKKTLPSGVTLYGCSGQPTALVGATKKQTMWIQLLEGLHKDEAALLDVVKDKNLAKRYQLTKRVVIEVFPELKLQDEPGYRDVGRKRPSKQQSTEQVEEE